MGLISVERVISSPPGVVYGLGKNIERFPEVVPDLIEVKADWADGARVVSTWKAMVSIAGVINRTLNWKEEDVWDDGARRCDFSLVEGDMKKYDGYWTFEPADGGEKTLVKLVVDFDLGIPLLGPLVLKLVDKLVKDNCEALLTGLEKMAAGE